MATRLCNFCKKPMFNSWCGEWVNGKFIEVHSKCKEDWKKANNYIKETMSELLNNVISNEVNKK